jgi:hypothetical protein
VDYRDVVDDHQQVIVNVIDHSDVNEHHCNHHHDLFHRIGHGLSLGHFSMCVMDMVIDRCAWPPDIPRTDEVQSRAMCPTLPHDRHAPLNDDDGCADAAAERQSRAK